MTQATATAVVHDLIGIGFGPSNIALAIALEERARTQGELQVLFLDKQADYRWHGNTLVSQSELQISFLKDLVSLRNPTSPYSLSLIHISEPTRHFKRSRMPSSA